MNNVVAFPGVDLEKAIAAATPKVKAKAVTPMKPRPLAQRADRGIRDFLNNVNGPYIMLGVANGEIVSSYRGSAERLLWMVKQFEQMILDAHVDQ